MHLTEDTPKENHQAEQIIQEDRSAFLSWLQQTANPNEDFFKMPLEAMRYAFIPPQLLHISSHPEKINLLITEQNDNTMSVLIVEKDRITEGISDAIGEGRQHVDALSSSDYVLLQIKLSRGKMENELYIDTYEDAPSERGKGVAMSYYNLQPPRPKGRLPEIAEQFGFQFISGVHQNEQLTNFFLHTGRYRVGDLLPEYQGSFTPQKREFGTIGFLNPADVTTYVQPQHIRSI